MFEALDLPFVQRGLAEVAILSVAAGLIGTWIVLRGLAFFSHAVGTAAFPGLVLADGIGFAAPLGALGAALVFALALAALPRRRFDDRGAETALVLVGMLALGVILASDVFGSSAGIESLLFGSLLLIDGGDIALAAAVSAAALVAAFALGPRWVAAGFDAEGGPTRAGRGLDLVLLMLIALACAASLGAVGSLLVAALFVVPAATTRLWFSRVRAWQAATVGLCAVTGSAGVLVSVELNTPPGATIAVGSGVLFACSALAARLRTGSAPGRGPVRWVGASLAVLALLLLGGCGSSDDSPADTTIVATTPVVADLTANVAGADTEVVGLLDAGTDPHEYEPRPDDIKALAEADVVLASGGEIDAWIGGAMDDAGSEAELVVLADSTPFPLSDPEGELDPHWWHDPRNAAAAVGEIADALAGQGADATRDIRRRARDFTARIQALDRATERCMGRIPATERRIVTDHDALGYLAARYGIEIVGAVIPALTSEAQSSAGELAALRKAIEREGVRAVFPEASGAEGLAEAISTDTGASTGEALYGDSLGPEGSPAGTYLGMTAANAAALASGMSGGAVTCEEAGL